MKNIASILGILLIIGSIGLLVWSFIDSRNYVDTTGTVISVEFDPTVISDPDEVTNDYKILIEYIVDGTNYTTEIYAQEHDYSVGESVEMSYDPNKPENSMVGKMSLPVLIGFSVGILVVGILAFRKGRRIV